MVVVGVVVVVEVRVEVGVVVEVRVEVGVEVRVEVGVVVEVRVEVGVEVEVEVSINLTPCITFTYELTYDMKLTIKQVTCLRCNHKWTPRQKEVRMCPKCKSPWFNKPKND